jgi:hypothetical protein
MSVRLYLKEAFCDWGSATKSKVRKFSEERLEAEIEWFGDNEIAYVDCCDANFGMFQERDQWIATKLAETKQRTGYPEALGLTWVKSSSERIIPIARVLASSGLLRGVSLSVQSLDSDVLRIVKRSNVKFDSFKGLIDRFDAEGLRSYTELILGLPGETAESFKRTWETLAALDPAPAIMTWNCSVFVNAPMNDPAYLTEHGIETFDSPMFVAHSKPGETTGEYERMVRRTRTLPGDDIIEVYVWNWLMLTFHAFGLTNLLARQSGETFTDFYESLANYCWRSDGLCKHSLFGEEYSKAWEHAQKGYDGKGWDHYDPELGDVTWPMEEASWLRLARDPSKLRQEIKGFIKEEYPYLLPHVTEQMSRISKPEGDPIQWGIETMWHGRRSQRYRVKPKESTSDCHGTDQSVNAM